MNVCRKCGSTDFFASGACKACSTSYRLKNLDKIAKRMAQWREQNSKKLKQDAVEYYSKHRDERLSYTKQYTAKNKEKVKAATDARRATDSYKIKAKQTYNKWREANTQKDKAKTRNYRLHNKNRILVRNHNRKALLLGEKLSLNITETLLHQQKSKCACCRVDLRKSGHHLDHITALSNGGKNEDSNIQLLCPKCNLSKGTRNVIDFMQSNGFLL